MFDDGSQKKNFFSQFTQWSPWGSRKYLMDPLGQHPVGTYGGVYILAHFDRCPSGPANHRDPANRATSQPARTGRDRDPSCAGTGADTCVAAFPVWFGNDELVTEEPWTTRHRLYVERRILWELGDRKLTNRK